MGKIVQTATMNVCSDWRGFRNFVSANQIGEIGSIVEAIGEAAGQTNLLAPNAAIEAISASAAAEEISSSIDQVSKVIFDSSASIQQISTEMGRFIVP